MTAPRRAPRRAAGFTLIEVLVALLLGAGVSTTVLWFTRTQFFTLEDQARQLDLQTTSRAMVDLFAREVRRAGMDPQCTKAFEGLAEASTTRVRVLADLNLNGVLDAASEDLAYHIVAPDRIERGAGPTTEVLVDGVQVTGSRLRYYDGGGVELAPGAGLSAAQRAQVRRVRLELAVSTPSLNPEHLLTARVATDVELRNRFFVASTGCP